MDAGPPRREFEPVAFRRAAGSPCRDIQEIPIYGGGDSPRPAAPVPAAAGAWVAGALERPGGRPQNIFEPLTDAELAAAEPTPPPTPPNQNDDEPAPEGAEGEQVMTAP
jgi:hypothetical protein